MLSMLLNWQGSVEVNGKAYGSIHEVTSDMFQNGQVNIKLLPQQKAGVRATSKDNPIQQADEKTEYRITVKQYMTKQASPDFDFMAKWNNNKPMPLRTMTGWIEKETRGMVYMHLHGDIWAEKICTCMCCGKRLTNPVSQYFGIGPECGGHNYVNPFDDDEQLKEAVAEYKKKLQNTTWEGWIIKSAITEQEEV